MTHNAWPTVPFGDLYLIPSRNGLMAPKRIRGEGVPLVNMREIFAFDRIGDQAMELAPLPAANPESWLLAQGDLLFARQSLTLEGAGKCSLVVAEAREMAFESHIIRVRLQREMADPLFYFYLFRSSLGRDLMTSIVEQVAAAGIRASDLARLPVPRPPLPEQRRISAALGALDDLADINQKIRLNLDRLGTELVEEFVTRRSQQAHVTLGEAAALIETGRRPRGGVRGISEGVPSIGAESIDGLGVFDFSKTKYVPAEFAASMRAGVLMSRDVLIYKDGGKPGDFRPHVGMFGDGFPFSNMTINEHVYRVRAAPPFTQPYLYFWLSTETSMAAMKRLGTGAAIPGLNSTALKSVPVVVPSDDVQKSLLPALDAFVAEALAAAFEANRLVQCRNELLPLLFSGRVRAAEIAA